MSDLPDSLRRARALAAGEPRLVTGPRAAIAATAPPRAPFARPLEMRRPQMRRIEQGDFARSRRMGQDEARGDMLYGRTLADRARGALSLAGDLTPIPAALNAVNAFAHGDVLSGVMGAGEAALNFVPEIAAAARPVLRAGRGLFGGAARAASPVESIPVWHASPHAFDEFTLDHLGSGEGSQAFGHGLYFAGDKGVADGYANLFTGRLFSGERDPTGPAFLYESRLNTSPENIIDLSRTYGEQPPRVQQFMRDLYGQQRLPRTASTRVVGPREAQRARDAGFDALEYRAGSLFNNGEDLSEAKNYVVLNPDRVQMQRRNHVGVLAEFPKFVTPLALGGAALAAQEAQKPRGGLFGRSFRMRDAR